MATFLFAELEGSQMRYARISPRNTINFYPEFLEYMLKKHGRKCVYCTRPVGRGYMSIDHVLARSRGGAHDPENLTLSCHYCNWDKGSKSPEEFRKWLVLNKRMHEGSQK